MLNVFLNVILPTFLVAAAGAGLQRWRGLSPAPLSQLMLYLLAPALVFDSLINAELAGDASLRIVGAVLLITAAMLLASGVLSKALQQDRPLQSGFLLSTVFPNAANLALPVTLLAFGEAGLVVAIIIFAVQSILSWSLGVFVAARSSSGGLGPLKHTLRVPIVWAIAAALLLNVSGLTLPTTVAQPIEMLGTASIPIMLLILGFQFSRGIDVARWPSLVAALSLRLIGGAIIAYPVTLLLGLEGVTQQTVIVVAAMPTAVFTTILATEFKAEPRFVTSAVVGSTLLSLVTLTALISGLQAWMG
ncbi:MAG: AEC family transporter [Dehalococcoidia bacterium]